jgi:hypothetical protein
VGERSTIITLREVSSFLRPTRRREPNRSALPDSSSMMFGITRRFGLGGQHDGDGPGAPVGPALRGSAQFDRRTAFDAVDDRMVEPIVDGVHPTGVHAAGRWRKERLIEGLTELRVDFVTPWRIGSPDGLDRSPHTRRPDPPAKSNSAMV